MFDIRSCWRSILGKRITISSDVFPYKPVICAVIIFYAVLYVAKGKERILGAYPFYPSFISLGFPMLFDIRQKWVCSFGVILCFVAFILRGGWISLSSVGVVFFMRWWDKKILLVFLLIFIICVSLCLADNPVKSLNLRIQYYSVLLDKWQNKLWGEGIGSFKKITEFHIGNIWISSHNITTAHSDLLQGFYELGIVRMVPILVFLLLPLAWFKANMISASYVCVLFQGTIDFPFYRCSMGYGYETFIMCLLIVCGMYKEKFGNRITNADRTSFRIRQS